MGNKYESLEELKRKKALLKQDIHHLENLLTFENTKESLSAFTNGLTDKYVKEVPNESGEMKIALKKDAIFQEVRSEIHDKILNKNAIFSLASSASKNGLLEDTIRLGASAFVGNYAKKNIANSSWKKKIIGLALVYIAPFVLRIIRQKLENYQKNRSVSSLEKLI